MEPATVTFWAVYYCVPSKAFSAFVWEVGSYRPEKSPWRGIPEAKGGQAVKKLLLA
ncbi:MAG: hypothetical protein OER74_21420 [Desulfobacteraceae bacterium]|nr:hypothetical protein [Desulfobacteraceae bacterium]